jgi:glycosyltransferase involved in cell wall biosynthesis
MMHTLKDSSFRRQLNGAVLYTYWTDGYTAALGKYVNGSSRNTNSLLVSRAHGGDVLKEQLLQVNLNRRCNLADQIYTTSPLLLEHLRSEGVLGEKLTVAQLGVEIISNKSDPLEKYDLELPRFDLENQTLIVTVSSDHPVKRLSELQQLLSATKRTNQPIYWLHIGAILPPLKSPMPGFDMHSLGHLSHSQVFSTLSMLIRYRPIFLNFSQSEGVPISLVEAALVGIPCIGTRVGGTPFIIEDQKSGILIDVDSSPQTLSSAIDFVCANYDQLAQSIQLKAKTLYHPDTAFSLFYASLYERWSSKVGYICSI